MNYRKKPVVIQATQWFKDGDHPAVIRKTAPNRHADEGIPWVATLEGWHIVTPGDWIITGVKGEHYPCKPDIFEMTYEPAALDTAQPVQVNARLVGALKELVQEKCDYMLRNKLGNPEIEHTTRQARAALAAAKQAQPERNKCQAIAYSQFLTDVTTAAGLLKHGKQCKHLAERIADYAFTARAVGAYIKQGGQQ